MAMLRKFRFSQFVFRADGDGEGSGGGSTAAKPQEPNPLTTMPMDLVPDEWKDHVRDLRRENQSLRERTKAEDEIERRAKDAEKKSADLEGRVTETEKRANERIIRAELKASALKAGMVDLDGLKLADLSTVKLNEAGEVEGADELMKALKEAKPYLFATTQSTSNTSKAPPKKDDSKPKTAKDMTPEEWKAEKRKHGLNH